MKNLLLLIGILFVGCEVAEVEDLSTLTQPEKDAIWDQIEETRDVNYLLSNVLDTVSSDSIEVSQIITITDRSLSNQGGFEVLLLVSQCDVEGVSDPYGWSVLNPLLDNFKSLHMRDVDTVLVENHIQDKYIVNLVMQADSVYSDFYLTNCGRGSQGFVPYTFPDKTIPLYGFSEDEAFFIQEQLNRLLPQID